MREVMQHRHNADRGLLLPTYDSHAAPPSSLVEPAPAPRLSRTPGHYNNGIRPELGQHTHEVLQIICMLLLLLLLGSLLIEINVGALGIRLFASGGGAAHQRTHGSRSHSCPPSIALIAIWPDDEGAGFLSPSCTLNIIVRQTLVGRTL